MANLADSIEKFILQLLSEQTEDIIVLQRNELADELACAPSQISYVLTTRFTSERGFMVESRRGTGGHIRIARIPGESYQPDYSDAAVMSHNDLAVSVKRLRENGLISAREASLIMAVFLLFEQRIEANERPYILRSLLNSLQNY